MKTIGRFVVKTMLSIAVCIAIMFAFYEVAPAGTKDVCTLLVKWLIVWAAIIGYRHGMNAIQSTQTP